MTADIAQRLRKHAQIHDDHGNPGAAFACRSGADELDARQVEIERLRKANDAFAARQEWWNEQMFQLEQERDAMRARIADAEGPAAGVPDGWQPIETAPKDGSVLMLWEQFEDEPFFGSWNDFRGRWYASTTHYDTDGNACVVDKIYSDGVTHWMPLPAAPQPGGQRD